MRRIISQASLAALAFAALATPVAAADGPIVVSLGRAQQAYDQLVPLLTIGLVGFGLAVTVAVLFGALSGAFSRASREDVAKPRSLSQAVATVGWTLVVVVLGVVLLHTWLDIVNAVLFFIWTLIG